MRFLYILLSSRDEKLTLIAALMLWKAWGPRVCGAGRSNNFRSPKVANSMAKSCRVSLVWLTIKTSVEDRCPNQLGLGHRLDNHLPNKISNCWMLTKASAYTGSENPVHTRCISLDDGHTDFLSKNVPVSCTIRLSFEMKSSLTSAAPVARDMSISYCEVEEL